MEVLKLALLAFLAAIKQLLIWIAVFFLVMGRGLALLLAQAFRFLAGVYFIVERVAVVALVVGATLHAAWMVWRAYGADLPALILAALLIVIMCAWGLEGKSWGTLLAGGLAALAIGATIGLADIVIRSLIVTGALATTIAQNQFNRYKESDRNANEKEFERVHHGDQDRPDRLHDDPHGGPGDVHPARRDQDLRRAGDLWSGRGAAGLG